MDTLSHGLWALALYWGTPYRKWAFWIGMIPDLLSFGLWMVVRMLTGQGIGRPGGVEPWWLPVNYTITHSLLTWIVIGALLYALKKRYWPIVGAAMAHIALDIFTHCSYYPTPFLEPLVHSRYCGVSWGTPVIFIMNWVFLVTIFSLIWYHEWSKRRESIKTRRRPRSA